ncbi:MAG: Mo-dependent nitrogenase C-terminal domain-containing protein [Elainella sp. Prado103]|jgi:hypothetical protein|nr:Mo-dependent nitrogenase C-terminal domain-containing protein [Elainella sp. Prado103]
MQPAHSLSPAYSLAHKLFALILAPIRSGLHQIPIHSCNLAKLICKLIPPSCPFERDIRLLGHLLFHIPPLCKLNPLYDDLMYLRLRALTYLSEIQGEDITPYLG